MESWKRKLRMGMVGGGHIGGAADQAEMALADLEAQLADEF